jgi:hypothetical protein
MIYMADQVPMDFIAIDFSSAYPQLVWFWLYPQIDKGCFRLLAIGI